MKKSLLLFLLLAKLPFLSPALGATPQEDARSTVVIYNQSVPESKELADFYCAARDIDASREIGIFAPTTEEITRSDYDSLIANPIREQMVQRGFWLISSDGENRPQVRGSQIHYAAIIRGMPLK